MRLTIKHTAAFITGAFLFSGFVSGCGGGLTGLLPTETVSNFRSWRILYRYDYKGTDLEKQRVTATHRALVAAIEDHLERSLDLIHFPSDEADVTVTVEEQQRRSDMSQLRGLIKREFVYYIEFFDRNGERIGSYREGRQNLIQGSNHEKLAAKIARDITTVLGGK